MNKEDIKVGQLVHYAPEHGRKENGIVKSITETAVFVVYNCGGDWGNYQNYTAANTNPRDLWPDWTKEARNADVCIIQDKQCDHEYRPAAFKWQPINRMECIHCGHIIND